MSAMPSTDANLLLALDALLREGSVRGAARRMNLSPTAMSHTLARLREATGDALFVRAGQRMVPTPRAAALRTRVAAAADEVRGILRPEAPLDLRSLDRVFTVRANDDMAVTLGRRLDALARAEAPNVTLRVVFGGTAEGDDEPLRSGEIDLDVGLRRGQSPELRVQTLYRDEMVIVVREGHPLARRRLTPRAFAEAEGHVSCSRRGQVFAPLDQRLKELGLRRKVDFVVPTFLAGAWLAAGSDRVAVIPGRLAAQLAPALRLQTVALPFSFGPLPVHQSWHPRSDDDAAHAWLRRAVRRACAPQRPPPARRDGRPKAPPRRARAGRG
jgi:DNA-binding transcriptional LysR family regulator